ncbi:MAG: hypothetical protein HKN91_12665 [Acidimicrobiia bacterium]|nr:hypothetical protein [Acidimicrobiia bacterium]
MRSSTFPASARSERKTSTVLGAGRLRPAPNLFLDTARSHNGHQQKWWTITPAPQKTYDRHLARERRGPTSRGVSMSDFVVKQPGDVQLIVLACEAGMGSSLMAANQLKKLVKKAKLDIKVIHSAVHQIPDAADVVLAHSSLAKLAKSKAPGAAVVPFTMFINDPKVKGVVETLKAGQPITSEL